jgi:hypothetical protein
MGIGSWITDNIGKPVGEFVEGAGDWLGSRSGGQTSNAPALDRSNFNLQGADDRANFTAGQAYGAQNRQAPQAADSSFRGDQQALVDRLRGQMNGQDSLSALQLRDATDQNIAQQRAQAASASPGNAAMMQRLAAQNIGRMNQGYGAQAAQLGIQERNAAANALAGVAQGARGQDLQHNQFNAGAQLQQRGMNDAYAQGMTGLNLGNAQGQLAGSMGYEGQQTARRGQDLGQPVQPANWERLVSAAGSVAPFFMARGGVVTQPTHAIVGEAGPEAIIPLAQLPNLIERLGGVSSRTKQMASSGPSAAPPVDNSIYARPEELSRARPPVVRPDELYRARASALPPPRPPGPPSAGGMYLHQLRAQGNR